MNDTLFTIGVGTAMTGGGIIGPFLTLDNEVKDKYIAAITTFATPVTSTYYAQNLDIDIKAKESMAYIESISKEELVAFKNELSKVEKNIELEEQIEQLLDESDNIRRI